MFVAPATQQPDATEHLFVASLHTCPRRSVKGKASKNLHQAGKGGRTSQAL